MQHTHGIRAHGVPLLDAVLGGLFRFVAPKGAGIVFAGHNSMISLMRDVARYGLGFWLFYHLLVFALSHGV